VKLVRSNSPDVARAIASTEAIACWGTALGLVLIAALSSLLIALSVSFIVSARAAVLIAVPVLLALDVFLLWRGRTPRLNWVIAVCDDCVYVRLFARRGKSQSDVEEPEIIMLEPAEIAWMSAHTVELLLWGPKPKVVEWLLIKPAEVVAEDVSDHIRPLQCAWPNLCGIRPIDPGKQVFVGNQEGPLTIEWTWCRPALRRFLQQVAQRCPSVVIGPEERSELDLNGIWNGLRERPNTQHRRMLVHATRLGFGRECVDLLSRHRAMTRQEAAAFLTEIEQELPGRDFEAQTRIAD
jgi:hypothetical protein